jgi:hypothetical protein
MGRVLLLSALNVAARVWGLGCVKYCILAYFCSTLLAIYVEIICACLEVAELIIQNGILDS